MIRFHFTKIVTSPFYKTSITRRIKHFFNKRNIFIYKLRLQRNSVGRNDNTSIIFICIQKSRYQISKRFSDSGRRFYQCQLVIIKSLCYRFCHFQLIFTNFITIFYFGNFTVITENFLQLCFRNLT